MPALFLSMKHSANAILFTLFIISLVYLKSTLDYNSLRKLWIRSYFLSILILIAPFFAIAVSQLLRLEFYPNNYDAPIRMFLCVPILMAISQGCVWGEKTASIVEIWLCWSIPIAILIVFISRNYYPATNWGAYRTTYFVDPLTFSTYTLLFSMLSIIGLVFYYKSLSKLNILLNLASIFIGFYLSITSGARTGWVSFPPFILILWLALKHEFNIKKTLIFIFFLLATIAVLFKCNPFLFNKLLLALKEVSNYKLHEINDDTSVAMRLSFYRMGIEYFLERPWTGWGDLSWMISMNRMEFTQYASEIARLSPKHGFHNEIITSSVRSGIWGLIASLSLFGLVFHNAIKGIGMKVNKEHRVISITLLVVITHLFFAGLFTEITNLTFLSAFIGIILSVLLGEKIHIEKNTSNL